MAIQVLDRAVTILQVVARQGPCSLTSIAIEASLPVSSAARIAASLVENGVLERLPSRKYRLGLRLLPLSSKLEPFRESLSVVHSYTEQLARRTSEDCGFAMIQGIQAVVADWSYGPRFPRIIEPFSRRIPLYCAFVKVLIAYQPKEWRERYLK
ncbi:MAG TPA: helix-turn-helix domain-containing protein, partial [Hyphomicrobiales bacterium]|nr:helix-turn-helix domain-containing protein [Hyphomicrobiales bacterium]